MNNPLPHHFKGAQNMELSKTRTNKKFNKFKKVKRKNQQNDLQKQIKLNKILAKSKEGKRQPTYSRKNEFEIKNVFVLL